MTRVGIQHPHPPDGWIIPPFAGPSQKLHAAPVFPHSSTLRVHPISARAAVMAAGPRSAWDLWLQGCSARTTLHQQQCVQDSREYEGLFFTCAPTQPSMQLHKRMLLHARGTYETGLVPRVLTCVGRSCVANLDRVGVLMSVASKNWHNGGQSALGWGPVLRRRLLVRKHGYVKARPRRSVQLVEGVPGW